MQGSKEREIMTTAIAEKDTCKYKEKEDGFLHTDCGQVKFLDTTQRATYCPNCGKKIERVNHES